MPELNEIFGADGLLARQIPGYSQRPQQQQMAQVVADILEQGGVLVCEAGTGTGKTFAYLVPALLSGRKVIVSTGTKNLQDQLYHRDLPLVRKALARPVSVALLKGRANYLCSHRLEQTLVEGLRLTKEQYRQLQRIRSWSSGTRSGDIAEVSGVPEDASVWPLVTSSSDNCLGQECPGYHECHLVEARRRAQEADLVVINHHLLCADMALKEEGFGELLPLADGFILDEAHQLPEVAGNFFGLSLSGRQLMDLARDSMVEYHQEAGDMPELLEQTDRLKLATRELRLAFGLEQHRGPWTEISANPAIETALEGLHGALVRLSELLQALAGRGKGLDSCLERSRELVTRLDTLCTDVTDEPYIRWFETTRQSFRLHRTPLEIASLFRERMDSQQAGWIFTSATLAVGGSFEHFAGQLGLQEPLSHCWDSPFDYPHQAIWYLPRELPEPNSPGFNRRVSELTLPILAASRGRAFLLYTSHRALQEAADYLQERLDYPMLVQGTAPRTELVQRFRELGNAVLLGTYSFWEGIDVRGQALSCVIIDKLPFASPGDPVLQARVDALRRQGGNPFLSYQVPQAVIALKQGAGRLIRDERDRGLLVVCDRRLVSKPYGKLFVRSLPPMTKTQDLAVVKRFFELERQASQ
jgi:ATP-dependent DNA helicase DinG